MPVQSRLLLFLAGIVGAAGVALSAVAAHRGGPNLAPAASFLVSHAPVLLALSLMRNWLGRIGGFVLMTGLLLFCGDLAARDLLGGSLFPYSAPTGGMLMIGGWLIVAASAFRPVE